MICFGPSLDRALWLANLTECLAHEYVCALSTGSIPTTLSDREMDAVLAKFNSHGHHPRVSALEQKHVTSPSLSAASLTFLQERQALIDTCLAMDKLGINPNASGDASCRVRGGFLVTAHGAENRVMKPEHVVFVDMDGHCCGDCPPCSDWRLHYDIYRHVPDAAAVVHAQPTYCTALSCLELGIPAFHYMVAAAGDVRIVCAEYATFGTQELSDRALAALDGGRRRSALLAHHGVVSLGPSLGKALWLANETELLAKQYLCALSTGTLPNVLEQEEMEIILAKFKTYSKQPAELAAMPVFQRTHAVSAPRLIGPMLCACCAPARSAGVPAASLP